jgi:glycine dehydrogenase subunit 2
MQLDEPLIFERGSTGRTGWDGRRRRRGDAPTLPPELRREDDLAGFPEVGELEVLRHFLRLSQWNYSAATTMYPLGSCTMKYNPVVNEALVRLPGFAQLHPLVPDALAQGRSSCSRRSRPALRGERPRRRLPAARRRRAGRAARHADRPRAPRRAGEPRRRVLIPSSAHGTNPASAALCGYAVT